MDEKRRAAGLLTTSLDVRAHLAERNGDPTHRAGGQRGVAEEFRGKGLAGEQTGEQAHAGPGVAAIDRRGGRGEFHRLAVDAQVDRAVADEFVEDFMAGTERLHGVEGVHAILAGQEIADGADTVGKSAEDGGAVGHAFVAGNGELRLELGNGFDSKFRHGTEKTYWSEFNGA